MTHCVRKHDGKGGVLFENEKIRNRRAPGGVKESRTVASHWQGRRPWAARRCRGRAAGQGRPVVTGWQKREKWDQGREGKERKRGEEKEKRRRRAALQKFPGAAAPPHPPAGMALVAPPDPSGSRKHSRLGALRAPAVSGPGRRRAGGSLPPRHATVKGPAATAAAPGCATPVRLKCFMMVSANADAMRG